MPERLTREDLPARAVAPTLAASARRRTEHRAGMSEIPQAVVRAFWAGEATDLWRWLGAHPVSADDGTGFRFAVWAPNAQDVAVVGDWNEWQPQSLQQCDGIWHGVATAAQPGNHYKFQIIAPDGVVLEKSDPFARFGEHSGGHASILLGDDVFDFHDHQWLAERAQRQQLNQPMSIYELHLGSWRRDAGRPLSYRELAAPLIQHVETLEFTHVEFMPIGEFPYEPSWGYQVTGYFAPTSRYGEPADLAWLIDQLHLANVGVLIDVVPAHFPRDAHGLGRFDGTPLFEHADPRRGEHPEWGTYIFDYGRAEVQSFLLASAHYWLTTFHVDGFRVDAVASMLYLDYARAPGAWEPNEHGGNWNLQAIALLRAWNTMVHREFPGVLTIAEESTTFPNVTKPIEENGLGFSLKWNMGWMHDTLKYFKIDPLYRAHNHDIITFASTYAFAENFVLPLSHDEVVHGKGTLLLKMAGQSADRISQLKALFGYQWTHPGKKLLFMGQEFAQEREWNQDLQLDWPLLADPERSGLLRWIAALNYFYRSNPALHARDCANDGFSWVEGADADRSLLIIGRHSDVQSLVIALHFTPIRRPRHLVVMPLVGTWQLVLSSDHVDFGGIEPSTDCTFAAVEQFGRPMIEIDLPPFAVLIFAQAPQSAVTASEISA